MSTKENSERPANQLRIGQLKLSAIRPSPTNPRKVFDEAELRELANSMSGPAGLLQPIVVRPRSEDAECQPRFVQHTGRWEGVDWWEIVAGERRYRAAVLLGWDTITVNALEFDDHAVRIAQLIENDQRKDVKPSERARAYKEVIEMDGLTTEVLASRVGKSEATVRDFLLLASAPERLLGMVDTGQVSASVAVLVCRLKAKDRERGTDLVMRTDEPMSFRSAKDLLDAEFGRKPRKATDTAKEAPQALAEIQTKKPEPEQSLDAIINPDPVVEVVDLAVDAITSCFSSASNGGFEDANNAEEEWVRLAPEIPAESVTNKSFVMLIGRHKVLFTATIQEYVIDTMAAAEPKNSELDFAKIDRETPLLHILPGPKDEADKAWSTIEASGLHTVGDLIDRAAIHPHKAGFSQKLWATLHAIHGLSEKVVHKIGDAILAAHDKGLQSQKSENQKSKNWTLEQCLDRALHCVEGAGKRWAELKKSGASNTQIEERIGKEFGEGGACGPGYNYHHSGGKRPRFWMGEKLNKTPPTLYGAKLVQAVRTLLEIPQPESTKGEWRSLSIYAELGNLPKRTIQTLTNQNIINLGDLADRLDDGQELGLGKDREKVLAMVDEARQTKAEGDKL